METQNPKHEILNSKQARMFKFQISKRENFRTLIFKFVSDFDIRISDF